MYDNLNFAPPHEAHPSSLEELRELAASKFAVTVEPEVMLDNSQISDGGIITIPKVGEYPMTKPAFRQLCVRRLHIPDPFAQFIPWDLLSHNIHQLFPKSNPVNIIRRDVDGAITGFAPTNIEPVSYEDILTAMLQYEGFDETYKMSIADETVAVDFPWDLFEEGDFRSIEPIKGDVMKSGYRFLHSPGGFSQTVMRFMLWRLVCLNGLVMPSTFDSVKMRIKPGREVSQAVETFIRKVTNFGPQLTQLALPDRIRELDQPMPADFFARTWKGIKKIVDNDTDFVDVDIFEVEEEKRKDWIANARDYMKGKAESLEMTTVNGWKMVNNLTHRAKEFDQHKCHQMENYAGKLLINQVPEA